MFVARIAAGFLLGAIALDLSDAWCDPLPIQDIRESASVPDPADTDACDDVCVPDCFCCSSTVLAVQPAIIERPAADANERAWSILHVAAGFSSVPEHVPITEN